MRSCLYSALIQTLLNVDVGLRSVLFTAKTLIIVTGGFSGGVGVPAPPPLPKIFKDYGTRGYIPACMYIMTNVHISRSILCHNYLTDSH